jgi:hypothetical protein
MSVPDYREKDGYTMQTLDVHGIRDGQDVVLISNVSASNHSSEHELTFSQAFVRVQHLVGFGLT